MSYRLKNRVIILLFTIFAGMRPMMVLAEEGSDSHWKETIAEIMNESKDWGREDLKKNVVLEKSIALPQAESIGMFNAFDKFMENKYNDARKTFLGNMILGHPVEISIIGLSLFLIMTIGKGQAKDVPSSSQETKAVIVDDTTLADYAGTIPPAVITLVNQIKNREAYRKVHAPFAKGILLTGLPGTGKSYLARAIAGELKCPFFVTTATEFSHPYLGMGEIMVRDLFARAKVAAANDPSKLAIIFIDEIDAVGRRGATTMGGTPHGVLETFLTEMDGFNKTFKIEIKTDLPWYKRIFTQEPSSELVSVDVVILAATNVPENLDKALIRPGRFDQIIEVKKPDEDGRRAIIALYMKQYPCDETVIVDQLAKLTDGMTPADINALFGEAARDAGSKNQSIIGMENFEYALLNTKREMLDEQENIIDGLLKSYPCDSSVMADNIKNIFATIEYFRQIVNVFEEAYKKSKSEGRKINEADILKSLNNIMKNVRAQ